MITQRLVFEFQWCQRKVSDTSQESMLKSPDNFQNSKCFPSRFLLLFPDKPKISLSARNLHKIADFWIQLRNTIWQKYFPLFNIQNRIPKLGRGIQETYNPATFGGHNFLDLFYTGGDHDCLLLQIRNCQYIKLQSQLHEITIIWFLVARRVISNYSAVNKKCFSALCCASVTRGFYCVWSGGGVTWRNASIKFWWGGQLCQVKSA